MPGSPAGADGPHVASTPSRTVPKPTTVAAAIIVALLFNALLSAFSWLPARRYAQALIPTPEALALLTVMVVTTAGSIPARGGPGSTRPGSTRPRHTRPRHTRLRRLGWALVGALLVIYATAETFFQYIFREVFVPWTDLALAAPFLAMLSGQDSAGDRLMVGMLTGGVVAVVTVLLVLAFTAVARPRDDAAAARAVAANDQSPAVPVLPAPRTRFVGGAIWALAALGSVAGVAFVEPQPLIVRMAAQVRPPAAAGAGDPTGGQTVGATFLREVEQASTAAAAGGRRFAFPVLGDSDIHLIVVESYGHTLFSRPDHAAAMQPVYERLSAELSAAGFYSASHFLRSPAFGGRSWLAEASILTGEFIANQATYDSIVFSDITTLLDVMRGAGYYSVMAAPATRLDLTTAEWMSFYAYDHYFFRETFPYDGPFFSLGAMPDQFTLNTVRLFREQSHPGRPLFVHYVLVTSHVPFEVVPPYIEDWDTLGDGTIYNRLPRQEFDNNWLTGGEYPEGYIASIDYVLGTIADYLTRFVTDDSLTIIVGDHQPRIPISEPNSTYSVPIHVVSRNPQVVTPWIEEYGFQRGIPSRRPLPHPGLDRLLPMLMDVITGSFQARRLFNP